MKNLSLSLLALLIAVSPMMAASQDLPKIKTLLITGDDVAPYHDWKEMADSYRKVLESSGRFAVTVCEDPMIMDSAAALKPYEVIVLSMFNSSLPDLTAQGKENLLNFVKGGKGFIVTHLSSASYGKWEEFGKLCGRHWVMGTSGHNPRSVFQAKIVNKNHPITKGMSDFRIFDELYSKLQGDADIEVLVAADSDFSGKTEPLAFIRDYGKGRMFHFALGHDHKAIENPSAAELMVRGTEWAATGKVTELVQTRKVIE